MLSILKNNEYLPLYCNFIIINDDFDTYINLTSDNNLKIIPKMQPNILFGFGNESSIS